MTSTGLDVLERTYSDRLAPAREAARAGASVVGMVGNCVPVEFVLASGRTPVTIPAELDRPTPTADLYMESVISPETRSLFDLALTGAYEFFHLLVLTRPYMHLYYYLKEVYRQGHAPRVPPLHMFDLIQSQRAAVRQYNWQRLDHLVQCLERPAGDDITDAKLWAAISLTNRVRGLQRHLLEQRWQTRLSGVDAMRVLGAGYFLHPATYADALATFLSELSNRPALGDRPRLVVVTSEPLSHVALHQTLEDAGALVVAEDDWWGSRAPGDDVPLAGSPRDAILQKYWLDTASSGVSPATAREAWFEAHAARADVDGIVFYLPPSDHQLGWDYPRLKAWLAERGKPSLLLRQDVAQPAGRAMISKHVTAWLPGLQ